MSTEIDKGSALRFTSEILAWVATPWAIWPHSVPLAVISVVVLIGLPAVFATPGSRPHVLVAVPGYVTVGLVMLQLLAAVISSWAAWIPLAACIVTLIAMTTVAFELPRWKLLLSKAHL
ncbi:hypothetical protein [Nonomuraea soli]|uniref:Uncharacterized protein n=1 Tax=Nonomuraea soli TaxID=1032476 RepID=A0A7W0CQ65_9ACTN|nr:hypothetical protein [Nonomuraea soli]MBA2895070.1 hypothetical protein [Nonomuraea soli]